MKKIIKLTEKDLTNIVKRIINEKKYKIPKEVSIELINRYLNEEDPDVLRKMCGYNYKVMKKIIKSTYIDHIPLKEIADELRELAKNGKLFDNDEYSNSGWEWRNNAEKKILTLRNYFLKSLKEWSDNPTE
jgi:hypothetical protein